MRRHQRFPNFKNLGVIFRTILLVNCLLMLLAFTNSVDFAEFTERTLQYASFTQPILFLAMLFAYIATPYLTKLPYQQAALMLWLMTLLSTLAANFLLKNLLFVENLPTHLKTTVLSSALFFGVLYYFFLINKAYSPAIQEARMQALQARIRPHFLFNSINAVLSLIRHQPKQAETALEDMADLFRVFMADHRDLVPLSREIALCKQYCALEKLRLSERLTVKWQIEELANHVLVPFLIMQPLLENAVYHGIEPMLDGGSIYINIYVENKHLHMRISNPFSSKSGQHHGNQMAINNIKERLHLHFDLEATLLTKQTATEYQVHIMLPHHALSVTNQAITC